MIGSKSTQNSEQFMLRTGNHSTKPSAKGFGLLGGGEDPAALLTPSERRASLLAARLGIERRLRVLTDKLKDVKIPHAERQKIAGDRRALKDEFSLIEKQQQEVAAELRGGPPKTLHLSAYIADIVKERMTVPQWNAILAEAKKRLAESEAVHH